MASRPRPAVLFPTAKNVGGTFGLLQRGPLRHIRINDLARELGIKSKHILLVLPVLGIAGNKNHSSSMNLEDADSVRAYLRAHPVELPKPKRLQEGTRTMPRKLLQVTQPSPDCKVGKAQQRVTKRLATAKNASRSPG